jgi:hypothetical protein
LEARKDRFGAAETVVVRLLAFNDRYEPAHLDRRLLVGPSPVPDRPTGIPFPVSVEPAWPEDEQNLVTLNPWCLYGRERRFDDLPPGRVTFHGYLLRRASQSLLPERPGEAEALLVSGEPLIVTVEGNR